MSQSPPPTPYTYIKKIPFFFFSFFFGQDVTHVKQQKQHRQQQQLFCTTISIMIEHGIWLTNFQTATTRDWQGGIFPSCCVDHCFGYMCKKT